jgi:hypothetical protein
MTIFSCVLYGVWNTFLAGSHQRSGRVLLRHECVWTESATSHGMDPETIFRSFEWSHAHAWVNLVKWCADGWNRSVCCQALCRANHPVTILSESKSLCGWRSVSQSVLVSGPFCGSWLDVKSRSDRYSVNRHVASSLTIGRVFHLSSVLVFVKSIHLYVVYVHLYSVYS